MLLLQRNIVAIIPLFDPDRSAGGIIIPDQAKGRCTQGIVKYLGPKCKNVKIADHVLFNAYTGTTISLEGEGSVLIFLPESGIEAIIEDPATEVLGLYCMERDPRTREKKYFTVTYEMALQFMARAVSEQPEVMKSLAAHFRRPLSMRSAHPSLESYNAEDHDDVDY